MTQKQYFFIAYYKELATTWLISLETSILKHNMLKFMRQIPLKKGFDVLKPQFAPQMCEWTVTKSFWIAVELAENCGQFQFSFLSLRCSVLDIWWPWILI